MVNVHYADQIAKKVKNIIVVMMNMFINVKHVDMSSTGETCGHEFYRMSYDTPYDGEVISWVINEE